MPVYTIQPDRVIEEFARSLRRRALVALAVLAGIIVLSTAVMVVFAPRGGSLSERMLLGLWDTLQLISTVGAFDDEDMTVWQRIWGLLVIMLGLGAVLVASNHNAITSDELVEEFDIELLDDYWARSLAHCHDPKNVEPA